MPVNSRDPVAQAAQALERGDLAMAERLALGVLERAENADAFHLLSLARLKQNRVDEALDLIRRSLAVRPGHAGTLLHLGKILAQMRRDPEAMQALEDALLWEPDLADSPLRCFLRSAASAFGRYVSKSERSPVAFQAACSVIK